MKCFKKDQKMVARLLQADGKATVTKLATLYNCVEEKKYTTP